MRGHVRELAKRMANPRATNAPGIRGGIGETALHFGGP